MIVVTFHYTRLIMNATTDSVAKWVKWYDYLRNVRDAEGRTCLRNEHDRGGIKTVHILNCIKLNRLKST